MCRTGAVLLWLLLFSVVMLNQAIQLIGTGSSLVNSLFQDAFRTFTLSNPEISILYTPTGSSTGKNATIYATVNFADTDSPFSAAQFAAQPDLQLYPGTFFFFLRAVVACFLP